MTALLSRMEAVRAALAAGPLTVRQLCPATGIDQTTLECVLKRMAADGMAAREEILNERGRMISQGPKRCRYLWRLT